MTKNIKSKITKLIEDQINHIVELRHRLHEVPEPGFSETQTKAIITNELNKLDIPIQNNIAGTGIVADIITDRPGGFIAIRADMDALPLRESTGVAYKSKNPGYSHSCGHDGHSAALVGTVHILLKMRNELTGRIRFIFQPAEETGQGAKSMIDNGLFDKDLPDAILGFHSWPGLAVDSVSCRPQTMMASCDFLKIKVIGKGGHGARPESANNPLIGIAKIVEALSKLDNSERIVSLCVAKVGKKANIIADSGTLTGTIRALDPQIREKTIDEVVSMVNVLCDQLNLQAKLTFNARTPAVIVDERLYTIFREVAAELLSEDKVTEIQSPSMGSEDFGSYLEHVPGLLFRIGMGPDSAQLHQSNFDFNDKALKTAMLMLSGLAIRICRDGISK
ncbi:MAG: M20 family metallopeptidase [Sedimentisphaerales bacterium]|nr:M20 family metallopeptidase [Sedimentisphaerales bacterium]